MQNIWFTSDQHYHHKNIIKYSNRPFASVAEMNEAMIRNYNSVVMPHDNVYHMGDFGFCTIEQADQILTRLNGRKFFIWGNHDKIMEKNPAMMKKHFVWAKNMAEIKIGDTKVVLCHYAMRVWNRSHHGAVQLYGHSHGTLPDDPNALSMDIGVDPNGFYPINWTGVQKHMAKKTWKPVDHHGDNEDSHDYPTRPCVSCGKPTNKGDGVCKDCQ